jgi:heme A synthase
VLEHREQNVKQFPSLGFVGGWHITHGLRHAVVAVDLIQTIASMAACLWVCSWR